MVSNTMVDAHVRQTEVMTEWMREYKQLDDEGRQIMAGKYFPTIKYKMKSGVIVEEVESTKVLLKYWRLFLDTSDSKYVSPERDWYTKEKPHSAWIAIYNWLVSEGYVYPDSAAGNRSHQWVGESYNHLKASWQMAGRHLVDMGKVDRIAKTIDRQYAADDGLEGLNDG